MRTLGPSIAPVRRMGSTDALSISAPRQMSGRCQSISTATCAPSDSPPSTAAQPPASASIHSITSRALSSMEVKCLSLPAWPSSTGSTTRTLSCKSRAASR